MMMNVHAPVYRICSVCKEFLTCANFLLLLFVGFVIVALGSKGIADLVTIVLYCCTVLMM